MIVNIKNRKQEQPPQQPCLRDDMLIIKKLIMREKHVWAYRLLQAPSVKLQKELKVFLTNEMK